MRYGTMKVTKEVRSADLKGIVVLPPEIGEMVTITITDCKPIRKTDKASMKAAMERIEAGINPSNKTLEEFRSERLVSA